MTTYNHVLNAIRDGKPVEDIDKDYALVLANFVLMRLFFSGKKVMAHDTTRERDKFESFLEDVEEYLSRDLGTLVKGSGIEPGLSFEERRNRANRSVPGTERLSASLSSSK